LGASAVDQRARGEALRLKKKRKGRGYSVEGGEGLRKGKKGRIARVRDGGPGLTFKVSRPRDFRSINKHRDLRKGHAEGRKGSSEGRYAMRRE